MADVDNEGFMKRAKDIINLLVVASLCWLGSAVQQSTTQIAVLSVQISQLQQAVQEAKGSAADRYTASSAASDFRSRDNQIIQNTSRLDDMDRRMRAVELSSMRRK